MLLGGSDDWTPPQPCIDMAQASAAPKPQVEVYPGVYHGFDGTGKLVHRVDVPNGVHPGQGVHLGGDPVAREASRERLLRFLHEAAAVR
jgi:dienelactone hydrolase